MIMSASITLVKNSIVDSNCDVILMFIPSFATLQTIQKSAIWIINVFAASDPTISQESADEYGTLSKVRILDHGWNLVLQSLFPDQSDLERADVLDFGVGHDHLVNILMKDHGGEIDARGIQSLTRVLHGVRDSLGVEFCPMMPDLCCMLLSHMPVSVCSSCGLCFRWIFIDIQHINNCNLRRAMHLLQFDKWCTMILRIFS
jgi:hypothetical protein